MAICPICAEQSSGMESCYHKCPNCGLWFQDPLPSKIYHDPAVPVGMSEADKAANQYLAVALLARFKPQLYLDIGCGFPWLAHCMGAECVAFAIDGQVHAHDELRCTTMECDFEEAVLPQYFGSRFDLVTLIHNFEHLYDPVRAFLKLREIVCDTGYVFIRIPDHNVEGWEAHNKPDIHPYFHTVDSILELCAQTGCFAVQSVESMPRYGQTDFVLRAL